MRTLPYLILVSSISLAFGGTVSAQKSSGEKPFKPLSAAGKAIVAENTEAPMQYRKALDSIKEGNTARAKGDDATAYCSYGEAIYMLNEIANKYPNWNNEMVEKQLKNITEVSNKLNAVTCKNLEKMKESNFRLAVWQRQVLILNKLDKIEKMLENYDNEYWDKWDKYIKDIWSTVLDLSR